MNLNGFWGLLLSAKWGEEDGEYWVMCRFLHTREKTVFCSDPKCEVVCHFKQSRTRYPPCTGGACRHWGGHPGHRGARIPTVSGCPQSRHYFQDAPTSRLDARPSLPPVWSHPSCLGTPRPCPAREPTAKPSPPLLATGPRPAPPACSWGPEGRTVHASGLSLQEVGSPATGVPRAGDILGVDLRTRGGDHSRSRAFESLVPLVPPAGDRHR